MFKIDGNTIYLTRGDKCTINLTIEDYTFKVGDYVKFKVYNRRALNQQPLLEKQVDINEEQQSVDIELNSDETKIGELSNNTVEFWYEIELNGNQTIIGYDDTGAKRLMLYPEGVDKNA